MIWVVRVHTKLARLGYSILWICEVWDVVAGGSHKTLFTKCE